MNETAQHTPGPWRTVPTAAKSAGLSRLDVVTDALPFAPSFVAGDILPEDAHLIAAAPEMLAALQTVDGWLQSQAFDTQTTVRVIALESTIRAAIERAEGRA